jgi:hypothetical protein
MVDSNKRVTDMTKWLKASTPMLFFGIVLIRNVPLTLKIEHYHDKNLPKC